MQGMPLVQSALSLARELHRGQHRRSDEAPFILHPLEVAVLLHITGHPEELVAAAILHDSVEKTQLEGSEIRDAFGAHVAGIVEAMTEDETVAPDLRRKELRRQVREYGDGAIAVFAADKVSKVRELRAEASKDEGVLHDGSVGRKRLDHYIASLALLEDEASGHPLVTQLRFELEALDMLPPGRMR